MDVSSLESIFLPLVGAIVAGGVIGFEREWRGRAAGFRTHILVSLASALLMLAAVSQGDWAMRLLPNENIVTDPTRMAHGVLTGIGFLCAGVIYRAGFSIHGLTTAASLWITSAIGLLFGAGLFTLGIVGTVTTALILVALRVITLCVPQAVLTDVVVGWRRDAGPDTETAIEAALKQLDPDPAHDRFELVEAGDIKTRSWRVKTGREAELKALAEALAGMPGVVTYKIDPRDD